MKGVVSAGSIPTAETGARILAEGGNAIDAAVGACMAVAAGEPTLTSLAGGGMMILHIAKTNQTIIHDFFGDAPKLRQSEVEGLDFYPIELDYGPTTQRFYVGRGAAGVPGVLPGLCSALDNWGTLPLSKVIAPACRLLRDGAVIGAGQAALAEFLEPILTETEAGRDMFAPDGNYISEGATFRLPSLADTLEQLADTGWRDYYNGPFRSLVLEHFGPDAGGLITPSDFDGYSVEQRAPLQVDAGGGTLFTVPLPAAGGPMIALMRTLFASSVGQNEPSRYRRLCAAMATADEARLGGYLKSDQTSLAYSLDIYRRKLEGSLYAASQPGGPPSTTHISVVDAAGNAVGVTFSHGESNGRVIPGTGIMMNNFLGEEDLLPQGLGTAPPGQRLATMMSPTILRTDEGGVFVLGTGGSNRIRTAILQVINAILDDKMSPSEAVQSPRLHFEAGKLTAEVFGRHATVPFTDLDVREFVSFDKPHMFFGGVNLAAKLPNGAFAGGADSRRSGHCIVV